MKRRHHRNRGITLMEALATVAVMAILLPVAMNGLSLSARVAGLTRETARASTLAEAKLGELLGLGTFLNGTGGGDFGDDAPGFTWSSELVGTSETGIQELRVAVIWEESGRKRNVAVSTLVYDSSVVAAATQASATGSTP
jgi:type II secretory pathway pseudopilin PulG